MKKSFLISILLCLALLVIVPASAVSADKLSPANKAAHAQYEKKLKSLAKKSRYVYYKYVDLTGDGVHELYVKCRSGKAKGVGKADYYVYTIQYGKPKSILHLTDHMEPVSYYKSQHVIICHYTNPFSYYSQFYQLKNGKFKRVFATSAYFNGSSASVYDVTKDVFDADDAFRAWADEALTGEWVDLKDLHIYKKL